MALDEDPFIALGLREGASRREVESAFRRRALRCHPDRHPGDPLAKTRFLRLSRAKETLLDPRRRTLAEEKHRQRRARAETAPHRADSEQAAAADLRRAAAERKRREAAAAERKRREAAEQLLRSEAAAAKKKQQEAQDAADAKRRRDAMFAEEDARERAAAEERRRVHTFDVWWQRHKARRASSAQSSDARSDAATRPVLHALLRRFAASSDQELLLPGPLDTAEERELTSAAAALGLAAARESLGLRVSRPRPSQTAHEVSGSESPWEPPEGTRAGRKGERLKRRRQGSASGQGAQVCRTERHRKAIERLGARRRDGEGTARASMGYWWVADEEADRYASYVDQCGF